jgi:hypothetical protein
MEIVPKGVHEGSILANTHVGVRKKKHEKSRIYAFQLILVEAEYR